jgi:Mce-associated membrane protein
VPARTDATSKPTSAKAAKAAKTGQVVGEPKTPGDVGQPAAGPAEAEAASADAIDQNGERGEPATTKRQTSRPRSRARTVTSPRRGVPTRGSGQSKPDSAEEVIDGEAKDSSAAEVGAESTTSEEGDSAVETTGTATSDEAEAQADDEGDGSDAGKRRISWSRVLAYGVLPALTLLLLPVAGFLKWHDSSAAASQLARIESVAAAKDTTIGLLSYKSETVEKDLEAAKSRLTGAFKDSYSQLIKDVVIPGAKKAHISTTATVPAAASVSATPDHAVTLLFVNQSAVVDKEPPSETTSSVRVTLDKVGGRWLISGFDPV